MTAADLAATVREALKRLTADERYRSADENSLHRAALAALDTLQAQAVLDLTPTVERLKATAEAAEAEVDRQKDGYDAMEARAEAAEAERDRLLEELDAEIHYHEGAKVALGHQRNYREAAEAERDRLRTLALERADALFACQDERDRLREAYSSAEIQVGDLLRERDRLREELAATIKPFSTTMNLLDERDRLAARVESLERWKEAYAKGRAGLVESADQDYAEAERLAARVAELEEWLRLCDERAGRDHVGRVEAEARVTGLEALSVQGLRNQRRTYARVTELEAALRRIESITGSETADHESNLILVGRIARAALAGDGEEQS